MISSKAQIPAVCVADTVTPTEAGSRSLEHHRPYALMTEVTTLVPGFGVGNHAHPLGLYVVLDIPTGNIMPGLFHPDFFRYTTEDDHFVPK